MSVVYNKGNLYIILGIAAAGIVISLIIAALVN